MDNSLVVKKTARSSNLEFYRVLVMLLIVAHHYVVNSGLTAPDGPIYSDPTNWRSLFLMGAGAFGKIGINCFVLITGYFMCKSEITLRKFLKLVGTWLFYKWTIAAIFFATGYVDASPRAILFAFMPFTTLDRNFVDCFVVFFLFIPFLNVAVQNFDRKKHLLAIGTSLLFYSLIASLPGMTIRFNYVTWFGVLYLVASYFRMYPAIEISRPHSCDAKSLGADKPTSRQADKPTSRQADKPTSRQADKPTSRQADGSRRRFWAIASVLLLCACLLSVVGVGYATGKYTGRAVPYFFVTDSNKILALATAVALFMFFKDMKFPQSKFVNILGGSTFAVLLIHAHSDAMRQWLWRDTLDVVGQYGEPSLVLHFLLSVFAIFFACVTIDQARIALVEKPFFKWFDKHEDSIRALSARVGKRIWKRLGVEEK